MKQQINHLKSENAGDAVENKCSLCWIVCSHASPEDADLLLLLSF
jgi:hypothetical protein